MITISIEMYLADLDDHQPAMIYDFAVRIGTYIARAERSVRDREAIKRLMQETKLRMNEDGYEL